MEKKVKIKARTGQWWNQSDDIFRINGHIKSHFSRGNWSECSVIVASYTEPALRGPRLVLSVWNRVFCFLTLAHSYCLGFEEKGCGSMRTYSTGKGMEQQDHSDRMITLLQFRSGSILFLQYKLFPKGF